MDPEDSIIKIGGTVIEYKCVCARAFMYACVYQYVYIERSLKANERIKNVWKWGKRIC
jgi:hypothetical protein